MAIVLPDIQHPLFMKYNTGRDCGEAVAMEASEADSTHSISDAPISRPSTTTAVDRKRRVTFDPNTVFKEMPDVPYSHSFFQRSQPVILLPPPVARFPPSVSEEAQCKLRECTSLMEENEEIHQAAKRLQIENPQGYARLVDAADHCLWSGAFSVYHMTKRQILS